MRKIFSITFLFFSTLAGFSQTNFFPLLECKNRTYTNATIDSVTPATVTVFWDGGGERIAITNLPLEIQKQYHYDAAAAEKYLSDQADKKASRQARDAKSLAIAEAAKNKLGRSQTIRIVSAVSAWEVQIVSRGVYSNAYIHNLPQDVVNFIQDYTKTKADVEACRYVDTDDFIKNRVGNMASHVYVSTGVRTDQAMTAINARRHLAELNRVLVSRTTVIAAPSEFLAGPGVRQWEYQGTPAL